ncbi:MULTISPECIES: hypothetical protein [unclassified Pseudarthrobacter]|uniref:hypothetical protein n=1 Tax=unclassified Pseudarthrobacter TaxID=2647000 RepID=UPI003645B0FD
MTAIPSLVSIVHSFDFLLPEDRYVRTPEARANLPKGTITIDADDCHGVADGNGSFHDVGLGGTYPADQRAILPDYIIAGPGLPTLVPGGGAILAGQHPVDDVRYEFYAIDTAGELFRWTGLDDLLNGSLGRPRDRKGRRLRSSQSPPGSNVR